MRRRAHGLCKSSHTGDPRAHRMRKTDNKEFLLRLAAAEGRRRFDEESGICLIPRDTIWYAIALLFSEEASETKLAHKLLLETACEDATHTPATLAALYHYPSRCPGEEIRRRIRGILRSRLLSAAETEWRDGNVNHPLGAYATLVLGGEMLEEDWAAQLGVRRLQRLRAVCGDRTQLGRRQGTLSEFNSLTYGALDLCFLAIIAEYARSEEARSIALFLEEALWLDAALHFHAPSMQFAGPHSRSYQDDSSGGWSGLHCVFCAAFEDEIFLDSDIAIRFNHPSALLQNALVAITPFHPPENARRLAWQKPFPFTLKQSTFGESYRENNAASGFDHETYPGGWSDLVTHMTGAYALGTASLPYATRAHSDGIVLRIARNRPVASRADFRSMFARGVFNDARFGRSQTCHVTGGTIDESFYHEEGRTAIYQRGGTAITAYVPKRAGHRGVSAFRVDVVFTYDAPFTRFTAGGKELVEPSACGEEPAVFIFQDRDAYGAIIPLTAFPPASGPAWTLEAVRGHLVLSLWNRSGESADMSRDEIGAWRNGFILLMSDDKRHGSFDEFSAYAAEQRVSEGVFDGIREIGLRGPEGEMRLRYDPRSERISREWSGVEETPHDFMPETPAAEAESIGIASLFGSEAWQAWQARR